MHSHVNEVAVIKIFSYFYIFPKNNSNNLTFIYNELENN
jgi:hypothetical protein